MGLGSCRRLLEDDKYFEDFNLRKFIGDQPLYANLGIAQIEALNKDKQLKKIEEMVKKLDADGLIIHINPLQEWLQPEGDRYYQPPIETIENLIEKANYKLIVKEVGHGMGPESLRALMNLPIEAIDFAAFGGTNFSKIELMRGGNDVKNNFDVLSMVGHSADEMIDFINEISSLNSRYKCQQIIISGGVKNFLDGYYLMSKCKLNSVFGMASSFLNYAKDDYDTLKEYVKNQVDGFALASKILTVK
jgi:isopentenyl-diphosphate delta-isomerase